MEIQPVYGVPALRLDKALVIGDLHIGVEAHLGAKGVHITSRTSDMLDTILGIEERINHIIILGDLKDSVPGSTRQEYREIPRFCDKLLENFGRVSIVRGNHDTAIEEFIPPEVKVFPATGVVYGDAGLVHGHTWPSDDVMAQKVLITCHEHPTVLFRDGVGAHLSEPCWLRGRFKAPGEKCRYSKLPESFIVVPAFNRLLGGSPVNEMETPMLGPVLNSDLVDLDDAGIYLLDGVYLGRRGDLMVKDRQFRRWNDNEDSPRHTSM